MEVGRQAGRGQAVWKVLVHQEEEEEVRGEVEEEDCLEEGREVEAGLCKVEPI